MTAAYFFLLYSILTFCADSCPTSYPFSCGNVTLDIRYPFFTNTSNHQCPGLHHIECMNLTPVILFHQQEFIFPLYDILYSEKAVIVHDLKFSAFFRGSDCVFLYNFTHPIPLFNVSYLSQLINSGQSLFNCELQEYDFSHDIFNEFYNSTFCNDYILYYSYQSEGQIDDGSSHNCSTSGNLWFDWKLSFSEEKNNGDISLLSAGFSREWLLIPDCFNCRITGGDCHSSNGARNSTCFRGMKQSNNGRKRIITAIVATGTTASILACAICIFCYRQKQKRHSSSTVPFKSFSSDSPSEKGPESVSSGYQIHLFSYDELLEATNSFDASKELGDGGFGTVYKGKLRDGRVVAVKRLYDNNYKRVEQFLNEVVILSQLRHRSLVTLYGCTSRRSRGLLLVYEFISNGTVADHLHGSPSPDPALTWPLRLRIAIESADALAYLHAIDPPIIHRDVKTTNILLDDDFHVKVADFGLSRLFPVDATHVSTAPQGTPGYVDPEYHQYYQLTDKSDVYSFGVVLIELISSKPAVDVSRHRDEINLSSMAMKKIQEGKLDHLVDPALGFESDMEVRRMITVVAELAFRCLQIDREMRPTIKEVLEELRRIESGDYREEEKGGKYSGELFSPDTVIERWSSRSSTPSTRSG